jgi:acetylornithine deacetylase/succinyl-diaminopimelate desuccinylase-like protein
LPGVRSVAELSEERGVRECIQWFSRERQWINEQHLQICRIPSPTFLEQRRAEWVLAQFRALGCDARMDRAGNVLAVVPGGRDSRYIALTAHLDTVLAPRVPEEIAVDGTGKLRGPGVSDNGAGLAALLAMARAFTTFPHTGSNGTGLLLVANVGEEGEGNLSGMRYLCRQSSIAGRIQSFLVLDGPTTDHITYQALASRRFDVSFTGPGGHSWSDYGIGNPVHALSRAISLFSERRAGMSALHRSSYNFGVIEGGLSINSIPTSARAKVDIRSESGEFLDELALLLTSSVERARDIENERATGPRVQARIKEIGSRPGGRLPEDALLLAYLRAVDAHLGIRARLDCASTDANIPLSMGIPAVSIGAGGQGGGAHTPGEWFHPEGRETGLARIYLTLCLLMRGPDTPAAG